MWLRNLGLGLCLWSSLLSFGQKRALPSVEYETARQHEISPHRRTIPVKGVRGGFNQLRLTLTVSATGDVIRAEAGGSDEELKYWSQVQGEVYQWKFTPFDVGGKPADVEVEEYVDLVPPERLPKHHVAPPPLKPESEIIVTLSRSGCFGTCPSYSVKMTTTDIHFNGGGFVVAQGEHTDALERDAVRALAKRFLEADFYSLDEEYRAMVTDNPTYQLSISIDGNSKHLTDYVGAWVGMPAVVTELEDAVDRLARTGRWINGDDGLVAALKAEHYDFHTFEAQVMLKEASRRGQKATVQQLLQAGVPLQPLPPTKPKESSMAVPFEHVGWLTAASAHDETLDVLIAASASKDDQRDKDLALVGAAQSGNLSSLRALIAYGANPNADLSKLIVTHESGTMTLQGEGSGTVLIYAAISGKPEMIREILRYHPPLEAKDREGRTALFVVADEYRYSDKDKARAECIRLLAAAGADVNSRDREGNTPLHKTIDTDSAKELIRLGADVNARNNNGETPLFTTYDSDAVPILIEHGANLQLRNHEGKTALEASTNNTPKHDAILEAMKNTGR